MVIYLHGYTGKAEGAFPELLLEAERSGFALAIPQGHVGATGHTCWNVGYPFQEGLQTDDVDFLCVLSEHLQKTFGLSREATFLTGMSNGGEMCYLMAALRPDVFRAVAPISGLQMLWAYRQLKPQKPVPLMELHGTNDTTSRWQGDPEGKDGWGGYIGVELAVMNWATKNGCTHEETTTLPLKDALKPSRKVILHRYLGGIENAEVRLYEIVGGVHSHHTEDMDTAGEIWNFFKMFVP